MMPAAVQYRLTLTQRKGRNVKPKDLTRLRRYKRGFPKGQPIALRFARGQQCPPLGNPCAVIVGPGLYQWTSDYPDPGTGAILVTAAGEGIRLAPDQVTACKRIGVEECQADPSLVPPAIDRTGPVIKGTAVYQVTRDADGTARDGASVPRHQRRGGFQGQAVTGEWFPAALADGLYHAIGHAWKAGYYQVDGGRAAFLGPKLPDLAPARVPPADLAPMPEPIPMFLPAAPVVDAAPVSWESWEPESTTLGVYDDAHGTGSIAADERCLDGVPAAGNPARLTPVAGGAGLSADGPGVGARADGAEMDGLRPGPARPGHADDAVRVGAGAGGGRGAAYAAVAPPCVSPVDQARRVLAERAARRGGGLAAGAPVTARGASTGRPATAAHLMAAIVFLAGIAGAVAALAA